MAKKNKNAKRNNRQKQNPNNNRNQQKKSGKQNSIEDNVEEELNLLNEKMDSMTLQQKSSMLIDAEIQLSERPSGLPNLGNTCYFNSIMQVMGQTYILHHALKERCRKDFIWQAKRFYWNEKTQSFSSETLNLELPPPTPLIIDFLQLQQQIFQQRSPNPRALLRDVQREKHQFEGYAQQDAQELLITLLDALKKAESLRQQKSLIDALKISNAKNPSNEDREKAQQYKTTAKHTVVDAIFGGQLLSIIHCTVCDYRSFTFEPFIDLALSLDCDKHTITNSDDDDYVDDKNFNNTAKEKQQKSFGNKNNKNKTGKKKKPKNSNKETSTDDDDDDDNDDSKKLLGQLDDDNDEEVADKTNLQNRKKLRQEKKAARRAERKRIKTEKQKSNLKKSISNEELSNNESNSNPDNIDNVNVNGNVSSSAQDEEEENEEKETVTNNKKSSSKILKQNENEMKNNSDSSIENDSELFDSEHSTSDSTTTASSSLSSSTNSSPSHSNRIEDNFRFKFYSFAHQRMSSMQDDDHQNLDLGKLLRSFIKKETLDGSNKYLCENCSKLNNGLKTYSKAFKCQLIALPPPILILQLKRFEASGFGFNKRMIASMHKLNTKISFPEKLYLAPYTSRIYEHFSRFYEPECDPEAISNMNDKRLEYTLYGVVIHSGSLRFGHYMAYVCVRPDSFECDKLKRFLHLKPFVSNIEHILHVVHERFLENGERTPTSMTNNHDTSGYANFDGNNSSDNSDNDIESSTSSNNNKSNFSKRKWYFISDSNVSVISIETVLRDATSPYLLFYERTK